MRPDHPRVAIPPTFADPEFAEEVLRGLSGADKSLPCRFFYDAAGSELFEEITRTRDYYPTRTETAILRAHAAELAAGSAGAVLVEFGSGSSVKTEILLEQAPDLRAYVPIDVSASALAAAAERLRERFPRLPVAPVVGDFTQQAILPAAYDGQRRIGFFPGSTIGNFSPRDAQALLATMAKTLGENARLVVGVDLRKDVGRLIAAYNDVEGVTATFNLNLLARINRELGGTFDPQFFRHEATWNAKAGRIEMYLVSERAQNVQVMGEFFAFRAEERIHTENSYKYLPDDFSDLARAAGWRTRRSFLDAERLFAVVDLD